MSCCSFNFVLVFFNFGLFFVFGVAGEAPGRHRPKGPGSPGGVPGAPGKPKGAPGQHPKEALAAPPGFVDARGGPQRDPRNMHFCALDCPECAFRRGERASLSQTRDVQKVRFSRSQNGRFVEAKRGFPTKFVKSIIFGEKYAFRRGARGPPGQPALILNILKISLDPPPLRCILNGPGCHSLINPH